MPLSEEEFRKIPYLDIDNLGGRVIMLNSFYDKDEWHMWLNVENELTKMLGGEPVEAGYYARSQVGEEDIYLDFLIFCKN